MKKNKLFQSSEGMKKGLHLLNESSIFCIIKYIKIFLLELVLGIILILNYQIQQTQFLRETGFKSKSDFKY